MPPLLMGLPGAPPARLSWSVAIRGLAGWVFLLCVVWMVMRENVRRRARSRGLNPAGACAAMVWTVLWRQSPILIGGVRGTMVEWVSRMSPADIVS